MTGCILSFGMSTRTNCFCSLYDPMWMEALPSLHTERISLSVLLNSSLKRFTNAYSEWRSMAQAGSPGRGREKGNWREWRLMEEPTDMPETAGFYELRGYLKALADIQGKADHQTILTLLL
jgi:hypothetical protein